MPATPLMFGSAARVGDDLRRGTPRGHHAARRRTDDFTFHHLPLLFGMVRASCLIAGLIAIVLVFLLASQADQCGGRMRGGAWWSRMCPIYAWTESCIRPEPAVVCLFVLSIFALLRALRTENGGAN